MYDEHSTFSSKDFIMKLVKAFPFLIREVQTDNGTEWTTQLLVKEQNNKTLFEKALEKMDIIYDIRHTLAAYIDRGEGDLVGNPKNREEYHQDAVANFISFLEN